MIKVMPIKSPYSWLTKGETYVPHRRGLMRSQFSGFIHIFPGCARLHRKHSKPEGVNNPFSMIVVFGKH